MYMNGGGMYGKEKMDKEDKNMYGSMDMKYRAENDVMVLHEAMEIKEDEKRYEMAMHCAKQKAGEMNEVAYMKGSHMKKSHNPGNHSKSKY